MPEDQACSVNRFERLVRCLRGSGCSLRCFLGSRSSLPGQFVQALVPLIHGGGVRAADLVDLFRLLLGKRPVAGLIAVPGPRSVGSIVAP